MVYVPGFIERPGLVTIKRPLVKDNWKIQMIKEKLPAVQVGIPAYNNSLHIAEAIQGCLSQQYPDLTVIVADDGLQTVRLPL